MDAYELSSETEKMHGIGLRSMLKKTGKDNDFEVEAKNIENNKVIFEVKKGTNISSLIELLMMFKPDCKIIKIK